MEKQFICDQHQEIQYIPKSIFVHHNTSTDTEVRN